MEIKLIDEEYPPKYQITFIWFPDSPKVFSYCGDEDPCGWTKEEIVHYLAAHIENLESELSSCKEEQEHLQKHHIKRGFLLSAAIAKIKKYEGLE